MKTLKTFVGIAIAAMLVTACDEGPSGPDPGQELLVYYEGNLGQPMYEARYATLLYSGDGFPITTFPCMSGSLNSSGATFYEKQRPESTDSPVLELIFENGIPTSPGTYAWKATKVQSIFSVSVVAGVEFRNPDNLVTYYPVEGTTVVTSVVKEGQGVTRIDGYFVGKMRSVWPANFQPSAGQPFPPGFDPQNPSLAGDNLTMQTGKFSVQSSTPVIPD